MRQPELQPPVGEDPPADRLSSWKEIAVYLNSGVRTVQRWERLEGLPVHRHLHQKAGTVYAYKSELDAWRSAREQKSCEDSAALPPDVAPVLPEAVSLESGASLLDRARPRRAILLAVALIALFGVGAYVVLRIIFPAIKASGGRTTVSARQGLGLAGGRSASPDAYEAYLKGRYFWNRRQTEGFEKAVAYFTRATRLDPNYAAAYAGLADSYILMGLNGAAPHQVMPRAREAALEALHLDDSLAEAHTSLAGVKVFYEWDWEGAEREFRRALELDPNYAPAHHWYANIYLDPQGRFEEAIDEMQRAQRLDPVNLIINTDLGYAYYLAAKYDQALAQYKKVLEMDPNFVPVHFELAGFYERMGRYREAVAEREKVATLAGSPEAAAALARVYADRGYGGYLQESVETVSQQTRNTGYISLALAASYARLGEMNRAMEALEKAYEGRDPGLIYLKVDPSYQRLRADPRVRAILRRMGFH